VKALVLAVCASVAWVVAFTVGVRHGALYPALGTLAFVVVVVGVAGMPEVRAMFAPPGGSWARAALHLAGGLAIGALTLVLTHVLFPLVVRFYAPTGVEVARLYDVAAVTPTALAAVCIVIVAEEVLWRGVVPRALERTIPGVHAAAAAALATVLYASAQLGVGSALLGVCALSLGGLWSAQAALTRSLWMPIASHAVWTLGVLGFWPIVAR
jgi:membrane protease YdiL (CAAX protease family)